MSAGKTFAVTAYTDAVVYHKGVAILRIDAGTQRYFVQPSSIDVSVTGACHLTECDDSAKAMLFQFMAESDESNAVLSGDIADLRAEQLVQDADIATNASDIASLQGKVSTNTSDISALQGSQATQNSEIDALQGSVAALQGSQATQNSEIDALQSSVAALQGTAKNFLPNWTNAVPLAAISGYSYTAPTNGWIIGYAWHYSNTDVQIKINGVQVGFNDFDGGVYIQVLIGQGDVFTCAAWESGTINFVPCKS